jgi:hypothetical protein
MARIAIALALIVGVLPIAVFTPAAQQAIAAPAAIAQVLACSADTGGADDELGQKDLTRGCFDATSATSVTVAWNWDDTDFPGSNTGDACSLVDSDGDGNANYAVCVQVSGAAPTSGTALLRLIAALPVFGSRADERHGIALHLRDR